MILAFHGEPTLKAAVMERLREHRRLDQIAQGYYFDSARHRGCHLGCLTHKAANAHSTAQRLFGIRKRIAYWLESIFEGLPKEDCGRWVIESTEAIPCGADLSKCHHHLHAWILSELVPITAEVRDRAKSLHERAIRGERIPNAVWDSTSGQSSRVAVFPHEWVAEISAESLSRLEGSTADVIGWFAYDYTNLRKIAAKSIEIFSAAPVVAAEPITECVAQELCAKQLWCGNGVKVLS